ncbi:MAG TPA: hypothetical protein VKH18_02980 [Terriglobales bacterium]|nr:hypothetical protein [Terriglobales bacterium]
MDHNGRLQLIGRVTYYLGWITLLCGGLVHLNIARTMFMAMQLSQRNLFEVAVVCFLISIASELRARDLVGKEMPSTLRRAA